MRPLVKPRRIQQHMESPQRPLGFIGLRRIRFPGRMRQNADRPSVALPFRNRSHARDRIVILPATLQPNLWNAIRQ
jgi:hypothetical protein